MRRVRRQFLKSPLALLAVVGAALAGGIAPAQADELPNGYAYEMVSPIQTQGQRVAGGSISSVDEGQVLTYSVGGYADTQNLPDLGISYLTTRTPLGWTSGAIAPPAAEYPFIGTYGAIDWTDDLERSLWFVNLAVDKGTTRFTPIVRYPNGQFRIAGPTVGAVGTYDSFPTGTSADLKTVLLRTTQRADVLTDGTVDSRAASANTMVIARQLEDGGLTVEQLAYRDNATMVPACGVRLGNATSRNAVSSDGQKIFFSFQGAGSCLGAANQRIWAKIGDADPIDLSAPTCTTTCGTAASTVFRGASRDGSRVFFTTTQKLVDGDDDSTLKTDLYEYDFEATGSKLRGVTASTLPEGAGVRGVARISDDGAYVYFIANGRALAGENARGFSPATGGDSLYVLHRPRGSVTETIKFIASLEASDATSLLSAQRRPIFTSGDGRFALFQARANLTGDRVAGDPHPDVFRYDAQSESLVRIWSDAPEHNGPGRAAGIVFAPPFEGGDDGARQRQIRSNWPISDDGATIAFTTVERLSLDDTNAQEDTYMWQEGTGRITMLSDGRSPVWAGLGTVSASGDMILFNSSSSLLPIHRAGSVALWAARRGGGFPVAPPAPEPCQGDACQVPGDVPTPPTAVGSVRFTDEGNTWPNRSHASILVSKLKAVSGPVARLKVRVPEAGRISVAGRSLWRRNMSASKAGTYSVKMVLSSKARKSLKQKGRLRVTARVSYRAESGRVASRVIRVTFKQVKRAKVKKGGR